VAARSAVVLAEAVVAESTYRQDEALRDRRVGRDSASDPLFASYCPRKTREGSCGLSIPSVELTSNLESYSDQR
jgi:hypothetical protein